MPPVSRLSNATCLRESPPRAATDLSSHWAATKATRKGTLLLLLLLHGAVRTASVVCGCLAGASSESDAYGKAGGRCCADRGGNCGGDSEFETTTAPRCKSVSSVERTWKQAACLSGRLRLQDDRWSVSQCLLTRCCGAGITYENFLVLHATSDGTVFVYGRKTKQTSIFSTNFS